MKFISLRNVLCALMAFSGVAYAQDDDEPSYKIMESHSMESPITKKEFEYFQTHGTSVMTKNRIILNPEIRDKKGAIWSKYYVSHEKEWIMDLRVTIGNE